MLSPLVTQEFEQEILELIENKDAYTTSDLQGVVSVLVSNIMERGHEVLSKQKQA
ncbi:MAG: hypothetical protein WDZ94_01900 [Patescibacteria group bacterium]